MIRACLYHRCSTLDQDPALAREELRAAARARGMDVAMEIEESGSGARNDRPGLQRVLDAARRGQAHAVLCWKLDRFGRSALDLLSNIKVLEDAGVRFIAITQGIDIVERELRMTNGIYGFLAHQCGLVRAPARR